MPAQNTNETLARRLTLLRHLPNAGSGLSAPQLTERLAADGYSVDLRTVQRDLTDLLDVVPIQCNKKSKPYGYRWQNDAVNPFTDLSVEAALTLKLVESVLARLLPASLTASLTPQFALATRKLETLADSNQLARWAGKVAHAESISPLLPPQIDPEVWLVVQECLLQEELLKMNYRKPDLGGFPRPLLVMGRRVFGLMWSSTQGRKCDFMR